MSCLHCESEKKIVKMLTLKFFILRCRFFPTAVAAVFVLVVSAGAGLDTLAARG